MQKDRPTQNQARDRIGGIGRNIVRLAPDRYTHFSRFQIDGWQKVLNAINNRSGIVFVAPTGSGKTEIFLMPVVYAIAQAISQDHGQLVYEQCPAGLEILYFLQSPEGRDNAGAAPTLIQSVMAMGHGVLSNDDRALVFTDSLDMTGRLTAQITDAERNRRL